MLPRPCAAPSGPTLSTTSAEAADHYRSAASAVCTGDDPSPDLRLAVAADPELAVAAADLAALTGAAHGARRPAAATRWERHHLQILDELISGTLERAEALLREHASEFGCDPLLLAALTRHHPSTTARLGDLRHRLCDCPVAGLYRSAR